MRIFKCLVLLVVVVSANNAAYARFSSYSDTTTRRWNLKNRERILKKMELAMGRLPSMTHLPAFNIRIIDSTRENNYTRYNIRFTVADGEILPAYLYVPMQATGIKRLPAMVALHETDPLGKGSVAGYSSRPNRAYAKELAQKGYIVIAPDYPSFGDVEKYDFDNDRYESGTMKGIFNHMRCIDLLLARNDVDGNRIGVIGHSLGGHNAMFLGAFDERVKVVVSSCGWTQMDYYKVSETHPSMDGERLAPWAQGRYMPLLRTRFKLEPTKIPFNFHEVISAIAPRAFFSVSPVNDDNFSVAGVKKGISLVLPIYQKLGASNNLQVRYPQAGHDFPVESRKEVYQFIDSLFSFKSKPVDLVKVH